MSPISLPSRTGQVLPGTHSPNRRALSTHPAPGLCRLQRQKKHTLPASYSLLGEPGITYLSVYLITNSGKYYKGKSRVL